MLDKRYGLQLRIPEWKDAYRFLGSRFAAQKALAALMETIPEIDKTILPQFCSDLAEIEKIINPPLPFLIKSPYSSSGRGLLWIPAGKLAQSERQIIGGMLKKQFLVSVEKALDKRLDFSMHFEISPVKETRFIGYSDFRTFASDVCSPLCRKSWS